MRFFKNLLDLLNLMHASSLKHFPKVHPQPIHYTNIQESRFKILAQVFKMKAFLDAVDQESLPHKELQ